MSSTPTDNNFNRPLLVSIVVSIPGSHAGTPGPERLNWGLLSVTFPPAGMVTWSTH